MKNVVRTVLFASVVVMGANGLMAALTNNDWRDQWYRAKFGRPSPAEEARLNEERSSIAFPRGSSARSRSGKCLVRAVVQGEVRPQFTSRGGSSTS